MNPIGYLILLINLQNLSIKNRELKNSEVRISTLAKLKYELETAPDFPIEGYREDGLQRNEHISVYISKSVQDYLFKGRGSPEDEGVIIKLHFTPGSKPANGDTLAYFIHRDDIEESMREKVKQYVTELDSLSSEESSTA